MNHRANQNKFQVKELKLKTGVRFAVSGSYQGEQIRRRFASREEAEKFADDYNQRLAVGRKPEGESVFTRLTQDQILLAEVAFSRLDGHDLLAVIDAGVKALTEGRPKVTLPELIRRYREAKERENLSEDGLSNIKKRLKAYEQDSGGKMDRETIRKWLHRPKSDGSPRSATTVVNDRAILNGMFAWAVIEGLVADNPVATIRKPKTSPARSRILTVEQAERLIEAATEFKGGMRLPYFALALFAGIRPRELHRLKKKDVNLKSKTITIDAEQSKTRRRHRFVTIEPKLLSLIKGRDIEAALSEKNFRRDFDAVRALAGLLDDWQDDIMRHSFGSYHLSQYGDAKRTAREMGNSEDIVFQNYYDRVSKEDAGVFWRVGVKKK